MIDLIEDLRLNHEYCPKEVILQAADEIDRLRRELAEARASNERRGKIMDDLTLELREARELLRGARDWIDSATDRLPKILLRLDAFLAEKEGER